jgi:uncharacterized protein
MQRDIEKVEELYDAYRKRDWNAILSVLAKDVEITHSPELPWGGNYRGHTGARQFLAAVTVHLDSRIVIERLIDAGDQVVAIGRAVGKVRATRLEFDVPMVHIWTFRDGQVTAMRSYMDNATMLPALGL